MATVKNIIKTGGWWVAPGEHIDDPNGGPDLVVTSWLLCGGIEGHVLGEFSSKMIADHIAKTHNQARRNTND